MTRIIRTNKYSSEPTVKVVVREDINEVVDLIARITGYDVYKWDGGADLSNYSTCITVHNGGSLPEAISLMEAIKTIL